MVRYPNLNSMGKILNGNIYSGQRDKKRDVRRAFNQTQRKEILYQQDSKCARCHQRLDPRDIHYHHEKPWASGGRTITTNGRAVCGSCHNILHHEIKVKESDKTKKSNRDNNSFGLSSYKLPKYKPPKFDFL